METPRPLTAREREVLEFLVTIDGPAAEALRSQVATAVVTEECDCGCGGISLRVDRERSRPAAVRQPISTYSDPDDSDETFWLFLWMEGGWISSIEVAWIADEPPRGIPSVEGFLPPIEEGV